MEKPEIRVAAAVVGRQGKLLICRRGNGGDCAHLYEFPGGKIEPGEEPRACAERECREELGIRIRCGEEIWRTAHDYPARRVALVFFRAELCEDSPEPEPSVHEEIVWVSPGELGQYAFCPADRGLIEWLEERS